MPKIIVDIEELDLDTFALIESLGNGRELGAAEMRSFVACFLVGEDGKPLSADEAAQAAGKVKLRDVKAAFDQIKAEVGRVREKAVPKATSRKSRRPSSTTEPVPGG